MDREVRRVRDDGGSPKLIHKPRLLPACLLSLHTIADDPAFFQPSCQCSFYLLCQCSKFAITTLRFDKYSVRDGREFASSLFWVVTSPKFSLTCACLTLPLPGPGMVLTRLSCTGGGADRTCRFLPHRLALGRRHRAHCQYFLSTDRVPWHFSPCQT